MRVVPHVEREEFVNAGVVVFCDPLDYLAARVDLDEARLLALAPDADLALVRRHLDAIPCICAGGPGAGSIGELPLRERWHWLIAPRSTILQTSPAHTGLSASPEAELERLVERVVRRGGGHRGTVPS
ncbi:MAG TPA: DUF3037 domain-containing protein [Polyangiaceae bacterium]|nr:DUF3037 domain-containing protein [Polyangiaceae bacterium]